MRLITLTGLRGHSRGGTSHRVNGIAIQPLTYGPHMPKVLPKGEKRKQRAITLEEEDLPIYNAGQRVGPPRRKVQEVDGESIINEARKKNLLFVLPPLHHAANKQKVASWTGFNILAHEKDNILNSTIANDQCSSYKHVNSERGT